MTTPPFEPGNEDPWMPERLARDESLSIHESRIMAAAERALGRLLAAIGKALGLSGMNGDVLDNRMGEWRDTVEEELKPAVAEEYRTVYNSATESRAPEATFDVDRSVGEYLSSVENRLVGVADHVFDTIRGEIETGRMEGESIDELAARIEAVLDWNGAPNWPNRAAVIARTETIGAYNMGQYAAAQDLAPVLGFEFSQVRKRWLATADTRTRPTHKDADGQTVAAEEMFTVGGFHGTVPGDPRLPAQEVVQCRCTPLFLFPGDPGYDSLTASGALCEHNANGIRFADGMGPPKVEDGDVADAPTGRVIVALPSDDGPIHGLGEEQKHITMAWLGNEPIDQYGDDIGRALSDLVLNQGPFTVKVSGRAELGADNAKVLLVESAELQGLRDQMVAQGDEDDVIGNLIAQHATYPTWIPHMTLTYGDMPEGAEEITEIEIDRLALWDGPDQFEYTLGGKNVPVDSTTAAGPYIPFDTMDSEQVAAQPPPMPDAMDTRVPWHGVIVPEGRLSGDRRKFTVGALRTRALPLPLRWQREDQPGHDGSVVVGNIEALRRSPDGEVRGWGWMHTNDDSDKVISLMADRMVRGVSVDADDMTFEFQNGDGTAFDLEDETADASKVVMAVTDARVASAAICSIPAFAEAYVALGEPPVEWYGEGEELLVAHSDDVIVAAGEGRIPSDLGDYWVHGEGAAIVNWFADGAFGRCEAALREYVGPGQLSGLCANLYKRATGRWPGADKSAGDTMAARAEALTASAATSAFQDPQLTGPTPLTITDDGRVYGHVATWGTCHIGFNNACVTPPRSASNYSYFTTGEVVTSDGDRVAVGQITFGTGHAAPRLKARPAAAHYDNTGTVGADVAVGEDAFGIWIAGALRENLTPQQVAELRASAISGDWRRIGSNMELVAALGVNVPGFPIPRTTAAQSGGEQITLVASGIVTEGKPVNVRSIADHVVTLLDRRDRFHAADRALRTARVQAATLTFETPTI